MSTTTVPEPQVRTYGNWRQPRTEGLGKFDLVETVSFLATLFVVVIVNWLVGPAWAAALFIVTAFMAFLVTTKDKHGMSLLDKRTERRVFRKTKRKGANIFRGGILSIAKGSPGRCTLPGVLSATRLTEHEDAYRRPFAVVHHGDGRLTVVMGLSPAGQALVDRETVDEAVALWGVWLADLSDEVGVVDASVTVETSPDTGYRLRSAVSARRAQDVPGIAQDVIESVVARAGSSGARVRTWATVSFDPARMSGDKKGRTARSIRDISTRLPGLTQTLMAAGAGAVHLLTAEEVCRLVRAAYDPEVERVLDKAAAAGEQLDIDWADTGPVGAYAGWDSYAHDSGLSCTYVMSRPPRGAVQSGVLSDLLEVSRNIERKRVTILYRPMESAKAPDVVENDVDKARNHRRTAARPTARLDKDVEHAQQTEREAADGASIIDFGIMATVTVTGSESASRLTEACSAIESLASASRLLVRKAYGAQDSAFALALPLGITPARQRLSGRW